MSPSRTAALALCILGSARAWNTAITPPMGFNTWNLFHCSVNATILTDTATAMAKFGLKDAGYIYVNSDDCWMSFNRSADGNQVPDPSKFPQGFKVVTDFIHNIGMKSGLYTAKGPHTCQRRAASCLHEEQDAAQWASWGIDYVKDDSCSTCVRANGTAYSDMEDYGRMWQAIQDSGRPMVLTVEGSPPADIITHGGYGNAKRVGHDISPSWASMISLVDIGSGLWPFAHGSQNSTFGGWWNDLDMIEIGNGGPPVPSPSPGPAPTPPPPGTMYPWAVSPALAGSGWTINGGVQNGGLCLTAGRVVSLTKCTQGDANQEFTLEANGNLHLTSESRSCVALLGGQGPALTMAACKTGPTGLNEMFTLKNGQLCSATLDGDKPVCLKAEAQVPGGGGSDGSTGFNCIANAAALARCQVHFTMWTIMKAPLLLGNNIPKMDSVALGVVTNKQAISISQDSLGVQARRVWSSAGPSSHSQRFNRGMDVAVVAGRCDAGRPTQVWQHRDGVLSTTDVDGVEWCISDVHSTESVGSWRATPCFWATSTARIQRTVSSQATTVALVTESGGHLSVNNAMGASGPTAHTRYLQVDNTRSSTSTWIESPAHSGYMLMAADRSGILDDDKVGGVSVGGDFCLDLAQDGDLEVWAGPLSDNKWAVALLNRDPQATAQMTVNYTMFNSTATTSFTIQDVWKGQNVGTHTGSYTSTVAPQGVAYLILSPE